MRNPLGFIPVPIRRSLFIGSLFGTLILAAIFQALNAPLQTPPAPLGIISLQVAWTAEQAASILESWEAPARLFAAFGLGLDYLFMAAYAQTLALGTLLASGRRTGRFSRLGPWAGWAALLAALCDGTENAGQFQELINGRVDLAPFIGVIASLKFALLAFAILYGLAGWLSPEKEQKG